MPITQRQVLDLMQESRDNITRHNALLEQLQSYFRSAKERFPQNLDLIRIMDYAGEIVRMSPLDDKWTERNEFRYRHKTVRANEKQRERAETRRRALGIPTAQEAIAILHAKNALRREGLPTDPMAYAGPEAMELERLVGDNTKQHLDAERKFQRDFAQFERKQKAGDETLAPSIKRPATIFPRDAPDDKPLEFDLPEGAKLDDTLAAPSFSLEEPKDPYD